MAETVFADKKGQTGIQPRNLSLLGANERQNISACTGGIEPDLFCRAPRS